MTKHQDSSCVNSPNLFSRWRIATFDLLAKLHSAQHEERRFRQHDPQPEERSDEATHWKCGTDDPGGECRPGCLQRLIPGVLLHFLAKFCKIDVATRLSDLRSARFGGGDGLGR